MPTAQRLPVSRFAALVWTLAQRDLKSRFKGTLLGWLWALILPLATLGLYAIVFGLIFRAQVEPFGNGHPSVYVVWLFVGLIAFNFFSNALLRGADSLRSLGGVLNRVRVPALAPILAALVSVGLQSLVELGLYLVVLALFLNVGWTWLLVPAWLVLFVLFTSGIAASVALLAVHFHDVGHFVAVFLYFLYLATPIMYPLSMVPPDATIGAVTVREIIGASPLAAFVEVVRGLLYDLQPGSLHEWVVLVISAGAAIVFGAAITARYGPDVAERLQ
jgi:ABC-type polysaccharide/polyol phosphate export permease